MTHATPVSPHFAAAPEAAAPFYQPRGPDWGKYMDPKGPRSLSWLDEQYVERQILMNRARATAREIADRVVAEALRDLDSYSKRREAEALIADALDHLAADAELCHRWNLEPRTLHRKVDAMRGCRRSGLVGLKPDGSRIYRWDDKCGQNKLCPDEAREEAKRLAQAYGPALVDLLADRFEIHFVTWSPPNVPAGELRPAIRELPKQIQAWRDRVNKTSPGEIVGMVLSVECHLSGRDDWNAHAHGIVVCHRRPNYARWRKAWGYQMDCQWLENEAQVIGALPELFKYVSKGLSAHLEKDENGAPGMPRWPKARLAEWLGAMQGYRRTRSYGALYGVKVDPEAPLDMDSITWVGAVTYDGPGRGYRAAPVGLIPDHNSPPRGALQDYNGAQGPPFPP